eukprot:3700409-Ditylum_brightwellii.AAC.1
MPFEAGVVVWAKRHGRGHHQATIVAETNNSEEYVVKWFKRRWGESVMVVQGGRNIERLRNPQ